MKLRSTIVALGATALIATTGGATAQAASHTSHQTVIAHAATTSGQSNALKSARDYLEFSAFSKKGLISQLRFEHYSTADAKWAVNHVHANWYRQAVRKAKDYLDSQSFSKHGLYEQLLFEKFTPAQARYGVKKAY
jgi:host cell surface-exposed lipoprotein